MQQPTTLFRVSDNWYSEVWEITWVNLSWVQNASQLFKNRPQGHAVAGKKFDTDIITFNRITTI